MLNYNDLLPRIIRKLVSEKEFNLSSLPYCRTIDSGVLFTDVKGFTKMTEIVTKRGYYSVEIITEILNSYFDEMYDCIEKYDGDLIKFGGDSILAIFPGDKKSSEFRMQACLLEMRSSLNELNRQFKKEYSLKIDFRSSMRWGKININIVGNPAFHLDYFVTGSPMDSIFSMSDVDANFLIENRDYQREEDILEVENNKLEVFFPKLVRQRLVNTKFGELKNSAVIFVKVENTDEKVSKIDLNRYHEFYTKLQEIVYFYEGTINKIDYTDKGYLILITFGVPFLHNDDIERAFVACSKISKLSLSGIKTKIGLTYNTIFSGDLGAISRYEYGIIGHGVNISARLMSESLDNDFTFSAEIVPHIQGRYEVEYLDTVTVKGIAKGIKIYHTINELSDFWTSYKANFEDNKLLGYDVELTAIENSPLVCLYGGAGSGKSHLIFECLKAKVVERVSVTLLVMSEYDKLKPFTLFYQIIDPFLKIDNIADSLEALNDFCHTQGMQLDISLIKDYFGDDREDLKEEEISIVFDLLTEIMVRVIKHTHIIVIENSHWLDNQSMKLLETMIPKLLADDKKIILTANNRDLYTNLDKFLPQFIKMKEFTQAITEELFQIEKVAITQKAIQEILTLTHNSPAYVKEICKIIKLNWISAKGVFDLGDFQELIRKGKLPKSFETALLNEFESLDEDTKQLLKYASIIGMSFSAEILDVFSDEFIQEHIEAALAKLTNTHHIFKKLILPEVEYYFNSSLMRDAIYRSILLKEKQKLHLVIANYYLDNFPDNILMFSEIVANHLILANAKGKTVKWCIMAAEKNYGVSAYGVSSYYYTQALKFCHNTKKCNKILFSLLSINASQNKSSEVEKYLNQINQELLTKRELDRYYFYKLRLYELKNDFELFTKTYIQIKDLIKSQNILFRIKLIMFDKYRMNNTKDLFEKLRKELNSQVNKQPATSKIIYYSILGQYYLDRAEYALSEENYLKLNKIALINNKRLYLRISNTSLGIIQSRKGNQDKALEYFLTAINIAEEIGDKHGYAKVNSEIAMIYFTQGLDDKAITTLSSCLEVTRYIGDKQQEQTILYNFGYIYSLIQEYKRAIDYLSKSRDIAHLIKDKVGIAYANDGLGDAFFQLHDFVKAKSIYEDNLILQKELHDKEGIAHTIGNLANVLREEKNYPQALEYYQIQYKSLHEIGDKVGEAKALFNWGITLEILGDIPKAIKKLENAFELFTQANDKNYSEFTNQQLERIKKK